MLSFGARWVVVVMAGLLAPGAGWLATGSWRRALLSFAGALLLLVTLGWAIIWPNWGMVALAGLAVLHGLALAGALWHVSFAPTITVSPAHILRVVLFVVGFWGALAVMALHHTTILGVQIYQMRGASMAPELMAGDWLIVSTRPRPETLRPGNLVLVNDPLRPRRCLIKRIVRIEPSPTERSESWFLRGDNPRHSLDSRHYGLVDTAHYQGRPVWRWRLSQGLAGMQWLR